MRETALDSKLYGRALNRLADNTGPMTLDETQERFMRRIGMEAMMAFEDEVDRARRSQDDEMRVALIACREKFAHYAKAHHAKGTAESTEKAIVNENMMTMITAVLTGNS